MDSHILLFMYKKTLLTANEQHLEKALGKSRLTDPCNRNRTRLEVGRPCLIPSAGTLTSYFPLALVSSL